MGSYERLASLEDSLLEAHLSGWLRRLLQRGSLPARAAVLFTLWAQRAEEGRGALARMRLLESERLQEELLAFSGRME